MTHMTVSYQMTLIVNLKSIYRLIPATNKQQLTKLTKDSRKRLAKTLAKDSRKRLLNHGVHGLHAADAADADAVSWDADATRMGASRVPGVCPVWSASSPPEHVDLLSGGHGGTTGATETRGGNARDSCADQGNAPEGTGPGAMRGAVLAGILPGRRRLECRDSHDSGAP